MRPERDSEALRGEVEMIRHKINLVRKPQVTIEQIARELFNIWYWGF